MTPSLSRQLAGLPLPLNDLLRRHAFDEGQLLRHANRLKSDGDPILRNRVVGEVNAPRKTDLASLAVEGSSEYHACLQQGEDALRRGECAMVVLAGGMATRMGGIVKALVEAIPGRTFLDMRLLEQATLSERLGRRFPLWMMTSHATDTAIRAKLGALAGGLELAVFSQGLSVRLAPDGSLFLGQDGLPSLYAPGHGDLTDALKASGLLQRFVDKGGRWLTVANLDNLGASLDPAVVGWHILNSPEVTCEVVDKTDADRGGIPVRYEDRPVVLEEFRLPEGFDPATVRVFNTNTFHFDARALLELDMEFTFFTVYKQVQGQQVVQFERLLGEVTSSLSTKFLRVPRTGNGSRFLPAKDHAELNARRAEIQSVARARGWL